jgi:hypothetical protein
MRIIVAAIASLVATTASAAVIAEAEVSPGVVIQLHDEAGPCVGSARLAVYIEAASQQRIPGCWTQSGEMIGIAFLDSDTGRVPVAALKKPRPS